MHQMYMSLYLTLHAVYQYQCAGDEDATRVAQKRLSHNQYSCHKTRPRTNPTLLDCPTAFDMTLLPSTSYCHRLELRSHRVSATLGPRGKGQKMLSCNLRPQLDRSFFQTPGSMRHVTKRLLRWLAQGVLHTVGANKSFMHICPTHRISVPPDLQRHMDLLFVCATVHGLLALVLAVAQTQRHGRCGGTHGKHAVFTCEANAGWLLV